jgi:hypothetical protein
MPAPVYRVTFFYRVDGPGWEESVHVPDNSPTALAAFVDRYWQARRAFSSNQLEVLDVRVSDEYTFRDIPIPISTTGWVGALGGACANLNSTAVVLMQSGPVVRRYLYCRGMPASYNDGTHIRATSPFFRPFMAFVDFLKSNGIGIFAQPAITTAQFATGYNVGTGEWTVQTAITGLKVGDYLTVTANRGQAIPRGKYFVKATADNTHFILQGWPLSTDPTGKAKVRPSAKVLQTVTNAAYNDIGERKVGRPFGLPVGRATRR